ncbi:serpin family protein [Actinophytocola sp.]|uniref:serpin family protein n=1 Tax=Actinophytocola sp. TaxID=1872138 RepID=UPI002D7ED24B|nr:serpin family protein [Actinophytocola sp.]HET9143462.1 serpin family protein [Actinophytocola sp.]
MTDAHLEFALALHRALAPDPARDACWSPFSVAGALRLVAAGAAGPTRDELVTLLLGDASGDLAELDRALAGSSRLDRSAPDHDEPVLAVANTLWADGSIEIRESFAAEVGTVRPAPFRQDPGRARELINSDVARTTRDLIPELVPEGAIGADTVAALVNALYLRCAWLHAFPGTMTEVRPFHTPGGPVDVPTMESTETIDYAATGGWQVLCLPAVGAVRAAVLLPDGDLTAAEPDLTAGALAGLLDAVRPARVRLRMPRLAVSTQTELTPALTALGVRTMFGPAADLSGISPQPLAVQAVLHESVLRLDEQGLEGAAATAVMFMLTGMMPQAPVPVDVDRPFLLLVQHAVTRLVYFLARVVTPG